MRLGEKKLCSHCGRDITNTQRRLVRNGTDWCYLCIKCMELRESVLNETDRAFLNLTKGKSND